MKEYITVVMEDEEPTGPGGTYKERVHIIDTESSAPSADICLEGLEPGIYMWLGDADRLPLRNIRIKTREDKTGWTSANSLDGVYYLFKETKNLTTNEFFISYITKAGEWAYPRINTGTTSGVGSSITSDMDNMMRPNKVATITAQHTYNKLPQSAQVPENNIDLVNKKYVDDILEGYEPPEKKILKNLITNGSFEEDVEGWIVNQGALTQQTIPTPRHGELYGTKSLSVNPQTTSLYIQANDPITVYKDHKYYIKLLARTTTTTDKVVGMKVTNGATATALIEGSFGPYGNWYTVDGFYEPTANAFLQFRINGVGSSGTSARQGSFDNIIMVDLTEHFGAGEEPGLNQIREIVNSLNGYWDGEVEIDLPNRTVIIDEGMQNFYGLKKFDQLPESSAVPTSDDQLVNKKYVDEASGSTPELELYFWDGKSNTTNPDNIALFQEIYNKFHIEKKPVVVITRGNWSYAGVNSDVSAILVPVYLATNSFTLKGQPTYTSTSSLSMTYTFLPSATAYFNTEGEITSVGAIGFTTQQLPTSSQVAFRYGSSNGGGIGAAETALVVGNNNAFTPTGAYNPATKKYVDDAISALRDELTGGS